MFSSTTEVMNYKITNTLVDGGRSTYIPYSDTLNKLLEPQGRYKDIILNPSLYPSSSCVSRKSIHPLRQIELPVIFGTIDVVDKKSCFDVIMAQGTLNHSFATMHNYYLCLKITRPKGQ